MEGFSSLKLSQQLLQSLSRLKFEEPTPIQAEAIPHALAGKDIIGSAQTGTGKTFAFGIPLVEKLLSSPQDIALVVTPTRELASQVMKTVSSLLPRNLYTKTALLIGGDSMEKQLRKLRSDVRLIVGTPGRLNDHLTRGSLSLSRCTFFILDETDRMLDMGFSAQIEQVVKHLPEKRQTLLFSATMPKHILSVAARYLQDPVRIEVGHTTKPATNIKQDIVYITEKEKYQTLLDQIEQRKGSIIVFVKTKINADKMVIKLRRENYFADALHGNLRHSKRERVIQAFRKRKYRIMVATDIASRGLDIPHIEHVINYDLPQCPEDYIHRIGRTARAGASGEALCLVSPSDRRKWHEIQNLIDPTRKTADALRSNQPAHQKNRSRHNNNNKRRRPVRAGVSRSKDQYKKPYQGVSPR